MPITELENDSESIWVKVFANKTSHFVATWYRPPASTSEEFQLFREQLDYIRTHHKGKKLPTREKNTLDLILITLPGQFQDIHSPDKLSDHDIISGTLKIFIPPIRTSEKGVSLSER